VVGSLLVVVIVGGVLGTITWAVLYGDQPATAPTGNGSGARRRVAVPRLRAPAAPAAGPDVVYPDRVVGGIGFFCRLRAAVGYVALVSVLGVLTAGAVLAGLIALVSGLSGSSG
jgi:hypothetical protein